MSKNIIAYIFDILHISGHYFYPILMLNLVYYQLKSSRKSRQSRISFTLMKHLIQAQRERQIHSSINEPWRKEGEFDGRVEAERTPDHQNREAGRNRGGRGELAKEATELRTIVINNSIVFNLFMSR